jgi:hypothetical protein
MNCRLACQRLLATSGPRMLPDSVQHHLVQCEQCQRFKEQLDQIDKAVRRIPIPDSSIAKTAFLERFLAEPTLVSRQTPRRMGWNWTLVTATSAAVVLLGLFITGWLRRGPTPAEATSDVMLEQMIAHQLALASADSVNRRVEILAQMAETLDEYTRQLALVAEINDLESLSKLFVDVLGNKGLSGKAELVPALNRKALLEPIVTNLVRMAAAQEEMAGHVPPNRIMAFRRMATAAREARDAIRRKLQEDDVARCSPDGLAVLGGKS